ncbi:MAG TPA: hypothetical protein VHO24_15080 [Opitutaceae bacterium]|nr:hypothetical protein [Opitutaceae bacterium]
MPTQPDRILAKIRLRDFDPTYCAGLDKEEAEEPAEDLSKIRIK